MKNVTYTVKYQTKNHDGSESIFTEAFVNNNGYTGYDAFVWKQDILRDIKKSHPSIDEVIILDCDTRVWNASC